MRFALISLMLCLASPFAWAASATQPTTQPAAPPVIVATTGPVSIPYKLTDTNHLLVRLKINGKGPFNFIVDTGAPVMILRESAGKALGLKPNARGFATLKQLDIEGGMQLKRVQCLVETPFQIEGMNAIGASGVDLDGMLGYAVLARFRMQIDLSKDHMIWTPVDFVPPPYSSSRTTASREPTDANEANLESMGGLLKVLGPMIKPAVIAPKYRGVLGIELTEDSGVVTVQRVLGDSPADKAGILPGDKVMSVNQSTVKTISDAQKAMATTLMGQAANLVIQRDQASLTLHVICSEGL
jgi:predicted aspartyl protease